MKQNTPNYNAWKFVDDLKPFQGSSLRGEVYARGSAVSAAGSWLSEFEEEMYEKHRPNIVYVVWSFYTPIAYFVEIGGVGRWYKVGQTFSPFTSRHQSGALRNLPAHEVSLDGDRGDWTVTCSCWGARHFTRRLAAERAYFNHR